MEPPPSLEPNFNSITLHQSQTKKRPQLTLKTEESEEGMTLMGVSPFEVGRASPLNTESEVRRYKQALFEKDEVLHLLGEKCL